MSTSDPLRSWLPTLVAPVFFPSGVIVRIISGIFIALGIAFVTPIVALIAFDIGLWLWRLYSLSRNAFLRRQRLIREEQRQRRQQLQQQLQKKRQQQQQQQSLQKQRELLAKGARGATTATTATTATPAGTATRRQ